MKYIVFDLDETLGYFTELGIIWNCLQSVYSINGQNNFNELCDLFKDEYFRPGIFKVFSYLKSKGSNVEVILYTNNTGNLLWLKMILRYMEEKALAPNLFTTIVPGFKPYAKKGPYSRTSFDKTYHEIIRCAKIPNDAKIIFFDDLAHPGMIHPNVTYHKVKQYHHPLRPTYIINKLQTSYFSFINYSTSSYLYKCIRNFHHHHIGPALKSSRTRNDDIIIPIKKFLKTQKKKYN